MNVILNEYVDSGKLSRRFIMKNGQTYEIYCYTKMAFFAFDWDEILISHRGKIYCNDVPINNPIPKIFNLDEHPSSTFASLEERMKSEPYEILDKVNGHLVIVSPDASSQFKNILVSTKGSFEGLAQQDEELLHKMGVLRVVKRNSLNYTLMFEALAEYDKHLWYEEQKARYGGEDTMVLLAAVDNNTGEELNYNQLEQLSFLLGCPLTKRYEHLNGTDVNKWFEHKGIEGYVVHFPNSKSRIKVKTKEYTTLRYLKEITTEKLVNVVYNSGFEALYLEFDEELYSIFDALKFDSDTYLQDLIESPSVTAMGYSTKKDVALDSSLNTYQKQYLFGLFDKFDIYSVMDRIINSKSFRKDFKEKGSYPKAEEAIKKVLGSKSALLTGLECV